MRMSAAEFRQMAKPKPSKYGNEPLWIDGIRFDSKAEGKRYCELKLLQTAGEIAELELQPRFKLTVGNRELGEYRADFQYIESVTREIVTEDVKSEATEAIALFRWKLRHFEAQYGRKLRIVK